MDVNLGTAYASMDVRIDRLERNLSEAARKVDETASKIEARTRRTRENFRADMEQFGRTMTQYVTAPLAAFGGLAAREAMRMDSLKRALESVAGSAENASIQMERLKEVAKLPGLGFQEAIEGSIRLQAAGLSARTAERALAGFGNALATVGKGKADLDGVTLALTQMASKGKVSAEEINQINERVPQIRQAMISAFGTADTEILGKAKITAQQFIEIITAEMLKLPKVTGGAANAFENLQDNAKRALSAIGNEFLPQLAKAMERSADVIEDYTKKWRDLPKTTRDAILGTGGIVASIGAITFALNGVIAALSNVGKGIGALAAFALRNPITIPIALAVSAPAIAKMASDWLTQQSPGVEVAKNTAWRNEQNRVAGLMKDPAYLNRRLGELETQYLGNYELRQKNMGEASNAKFDAAMAATKAEIAKVREAQNALVGTSGASSKPVLDAQKMADAAKAAKDAQGDAERAAKEAAREREQRAQDSRRFNEDIARLRDEFQGRRVGARNEFTENLPKLGLMRSDMLYRAQIAKIDLEESRYKDALVSKAGVSVIQTSQAIANGLVSGIESMRKAVENAIASRGGAAIESIGTSIANVIEGVLKSVKASVDLKAARDAHIAKLKEGEEFMGRVNDTWQQDVAKRADVYREKMKQDKAQREDDRKAWNERMRDARFEIGNQIGPTFAQNLGDEFGASFSEALRRRLGNNILGRALARTFERMFNGVIDRTVDGWVEKMAQASTSKAMPWVGGNNVAEGDMGGFGAGGNKNLMLGLSGAYALSQATQKKKVGSLLGFGAGLAFGGPIGASVGSMIGGLLGFADGGWVPGPVGAPQLAVVHGGEHVASRKMIETGVGHGGGGLTVNINGDNHFSNDYDVDRLVDRVAWQTRHRLASTLGV